MGNQYYYHVVREEQDYLLIKKIQRTCVTEKCSNFSFCVFNWLLKTKSMEFLSWLCLIWPKHLHEWIFVSRILCSGHSLIISTSYFSSLDFLLIMNLEGLKSNIFQKKNNEYLVFAVFKQLYFFLEFQTLPRIFFLFNLCYK